VTHIKNIGIALSIALLLSYTGIVNIAVFPQITKDANA